MDSILYEAGKQECCEITLLDNDLMHTGNHSINLTSWVEFPLVIVTGVKFQWPNGLVTSGLRKLLHSMSWSPVLTESEQHYGWMDWNDNSVSCSSNCRRQRVTNPWLCWWLRSMGNEATSFYVYTRTSNIKHVLPGPVRSQSCLVYKHVLPHTCIVTEWHSKWYSTITWAVVTWSVSDGLWAGRLQGRD